MSRQGNELTRYKGCTVLKMDSVAFFLSITLVNLSTKHLVN